jgi:hypothetical protein
MRLVTTTSLEQPNQTDPRHDYYYRSLTNCFRIFNEQNELPDRKKVLYKVNSKFKNLATKTKKYILCVPLITQQLAAGPA